jgi:Domain of unknown function (DUF1836).
LNKTTFTYEFYLLTEPLILLDIWFLILYTDVMKTNKEIINDMIKHFEGLDIVKSEDIPDISLYMDQMTSFIDEKLESFKREEDDKLLTKTMINNYTKNKLLPPSDKKKYTKNHVMLLILIYFYKNVLSFADIKRLCDLSIYNSFDKGDESLSKLYDILVHIEDDKKKEIVDDLKERLEYAKNKVDAFDKKDENVELFTFLSDIVMEVYFKQHLIEYILNKI